MTAEPIPRERLTPKGLADTGALLALLDRDDRWHEPCLEAFSKMSLPLATSGAVLAELFHLLGDHPWDLQSAWGLLRSGAIVLLPLDDDDLPALQDLMQRYSDRPMDFADATLVRLAQRESLHVVFTIDHDDFETYRVKGKKRFEIRPRRT